MPDLIQITYASRSTFAAAAGHRNIESNVARILAKARANNRRDGLAGVLYFGNGYFFQCLEGKAGAVEALLARLLADPRHAGLQVLTRKRITERTFEDWSMKYVPVEQALVDLPPALAATPKIVSRQVDGAGWEAMGEMQVD